MKLIQILPIAMLVASNIFMTYAWYGHLKDLRAKPVMLAIVLSWCVAFFEYCLQVPANRMGSHIYSLPQLKIIQEIITMCVFALFCIAYMKQRLTLDFLWAGLCIVAAAFFMFRNMQPVP